MQTDVAFVITNFAFQLFVELAVGQMIYGPLLERFGRKRPLYVGLVIYAMASLGCAMAGSVEQLIFSDSCSI
ncbi:MAG: MFS transporter [Bacteroidia bacterium]